ncbi:MAG TPA: beta-ketoacyl synthase N-terminal-like domain-containing protein, partial [Pyrinomonadaceae bacterium]
QTAILHNLRGVNTTVCVGGASGLQAVAHATDLIRGGHADALLAGGGDELCFESLYAFRRAGLLCGEGGDFPIPFDARRNGSALSEGAAILMLEHEGSARERGSRALAEVKGCGSAYDPSRGRVEELSVASVARSMRQALRDARLTPSEIDCLSASANGSPSGDRREARAVAGVFGERARKLPVTAVKSMLGEALGAAGATQAVAVLSTLRDGVLPGVKNLEEFEHDFPLTSPRAANQTIKVAHALINSVGHDGHCCSLVLAGTRLP